MWDKPTFFSQLLGYCTSLHPHHRMDEDQGLPWRQRGGGHPQKRSQKGSQQRHGPFRAPNHLHGYGVDSGKTIGRR